METYTKTNKRTFLLIGKFGLGIDSVRKEIFEISATFFGILDILRSLSTFNVNEHQNIKSIQ